MMKDKYVKALDFMVKLNFTDGCKGYDAGQKQCYCFKQFLGEEMSQMEAKNFLETFVLIFGKPLEKMRMKRW